MHLKLLSIAAAVALAFAGAAAQAQSTMSDKPRVGARADGTPDTSPKVDRKAKKAEEDRIEADYKAAKAKCNSLKGNEKEVCEADAKGKERIAKAELENKYEPTPAHVLEFPPTRPQFARILSLARRSRLPQWSRWDSNPRPDDYESPALTG